MNTYITLDSKKYKTTHKTWRPEPAVPSTSRILLDGTLDSTFGNAVVYFFGGEIVAPVTPDGVGWGSVVDLRTSLEKKSQLTLIDHYGTTYTVALQGPYTERSLMPNWDNAGNTIYIGVKLMGVK